MDNPADKLALQLLALQLLAKRIDERIGQTKDKLRREISPGTLLRPALGDGVKAGSVSYTQPEPRARVIDMDALAAWCARRYPRETELVQRVRPAFVVKLLDLSTAAGQPIGPGGEVDDPPPGLLVAISTPTVVVRLDPERVAQLWDAARMWTDLVEVEQ